MTKQEAFDKLWIDHNWCEMGYDYGTLYRSMTLKAVLKRLKEAENG